MSRWKLSQAIEFVRLGLVIPLVERIAGALRLARETAAGACSAIVLQPIGACARFFAALRQRRAAQTAEPEAEQTQPLDPFQRFEHHAFQRSEYVEYYAEPDALPMDEEPAAAPAKRPPLATRLRTFAVEAAALIRGLSYDAVRSAAGGFASLGAGLVAKIRAPRQTAAELAAASRAGLLAAQRRIASLRRMDATVAGLFIMALLGPLVAPKLSDEATIALTRHNPLVSAWA